MKDLLNDADIRRVGRLLEALEQSSFEYMQLVSGGLKLTVGKNAPPAETPQAPQTAPPAPPSPPPAAPPLSVDPAPPLSVNPAPAAPVTAKAAPPLRAASEDGTVAVKSPLIGIFYGKPDPASPPFVSVGTEVDATTTVGLVEVMKVFNAVPAGAKGVITEICVEDTQMVEIGQPLFRLRPTKS